MNISFRILVARLIAVCVLGSASVSLAANSSFVQTAKLMTSDKASEDQFGSSTAISGNTLLIGAPGDDDSGTSSGAAYVFVKDTNGQWQQTQKLLASDGATGNFFGASVALLNDTAFIGARGESSQGGFAGAVYVFVRNTDGLWVETQKLLASDGTAGRLFGFSVALTDKLAVIGAQGNNSDGTFSGAAYVFVPVLDQDGHVQWQESQKLTSNDAYGYEFGCSVAASANTILIGVCSDSEHGFLSGAAYLFTLNSEDQWQAFQKLAASDESGGEEFGSGVAISDTIAVIGAPFANGEKDRSGAVYVFAPGDPSSGGFWNEIQQLFANDGATNDTFGSSVAITANRMLITAPGNTEKGTSAGAVYFFALDQSAGSAGGWTQVQKITGRDEVTGDLFGQSLALTEDTALVGSPGDDITETNTDNTTTTFSNAGSLYVLSLAPFPGVCTSKTDYTTDSCSGTFTVTSLIDLQTYIDDNYGLKDNNNKYKNLKITGNLGDRPDTNLIIASPCTITLQGGVRLAGDFLSLDGRKGVVGDHGYELEAKKACVLSNQDRAILGSGSIVNVEDLTIQAATAATIGKNASITVDGDLLIESIGNSDSSQALLDSGAVVTAGSIRMEAPRSVTLGGNTTVAIDGALFLTSTGTSSKSKASIGDGARMQSTDVTITAPQEARVGKDAAIRILGQLKMESTGSGGTAIIAKNARVEVGETADITSANTTVLDKNTVVTVTEDFHLQAGDPGKCKINKGVTIAAGSTSGNCFQPK